MMQKRPAVIVKPANLDESETTEGSMPPEVPDSQPPPLIPIRPRPVEDVAITDKVRFYKPPGPGAPLQGMPAEEFRPHAFGSSAAPQKLIPLSDIAAKTSSDEDAEETPIPKKPVQDASAGRGSSRPPDQFTKLMTDTLQNLSAQLGLSRATAKKVIAPQATPLEQQVEPQTLSDILLDLSHVDPNIEASSLVRQDGTILAAASSRRLNDNLLATIAGTLSIISSDIMQATEAGKHKFTAIHGTQGILFIAPLLQDIFLIVFTSPLSRPGVINVATHRVKAQLKKYLGMNKSVE
jgi:predicted regulator of Ras-like GTPase activity (Roadblock/LC7/MglB family)